MGTLFCSECRSALSAQIENTLVEGTAYKHLTPVWSCSRCMKSLPVKYKERMLWVDQIDWTIKAFLYGLDRNNAEECIGCCMKRHMHANIEQLLSGKFFLWRFDSVQVPVWSCSVCGYTSMILWEDRHSWADKYQSWS